MSQPDITNVSQFLKLNNIQPVVHLGNNKKRLFQNV